MKLIEARRLTPGDLVRGGGAPRGHQLVVSVQQYSYSDDIVQVQSLNGVSMRVETMRLYSFIEVNVIARLSCEH